MQEKIENACVFFENQGVLSRHFCTGQDGRELVRRFTQEGRITEMVEVSWPHRAEVVERHQAAAYFRSVAKRLQRNIRIKSAMAENGIAFDPDLLKKISLVMTTLGV